MVEALNDPWTELFETMGSKFAVDRICGVVASPVAAEMMSQLQLALHLTKTIELRLDWLPNVREITRFLDQLRNLRIRPSVRLLATCRRVEAGGKFRGEVTGQLAILRLAIECGCSCADLEIESAKVLRAGGLRRLLGPGNHIVSYHNFRGTPRRLESVVTPLRHAGGVVVKIATQCETITESLRVLNLALGKNDVIAVPMGEAGLPARVLALRSGSALAYAPVQNSTAPGQVSLQEMKQLYRAGGLNSRTQVHGLIGNPVGHSLSPRMQNNAFVARKMNAVFLPFLVRELPDFLDAIGPLGIRGFSVTIPFKQKILPRLDRCDPLAAEIGAVNTVKVRGGKLHGYNTDYLGVLRALKGRIALAGSRVLILGAGGAARAVAFALARQGAAIHLCARRPERAKVLARAVGGASIPRAGLKHENFDLIVNATPVGMFPYTDASPLETAELNCRLLFDIIYRPLETKLMQLARRRGIETVSGLEMFLSQGMAQFEIWTGKPAPESVMRRTVLEALKK
ncbi:MAG: shikimate dehydrogenase [Candidatus Acidiferrales bacterium]